MNPLDKTIKIPVGKEQKKTEENWYKQVEKVGVALTKRYIMKDFRDNPQWIVVNNLGERYTKMKIQNSWGVEDGFLQDFEDKAYDLGVYRRPTGDGGIDFKMYIYQALIELNKEKKISFVGDDMMSPTYIVKYSDWASYTDKKHIEYLEWYIKEYRKEFDEGVKFRVDLYEQS
jgi:hypothetical protein